MERGRFDEITKQLSRPHSRRRAVVALFGGLLGGTLAGTGGGVEAARRAKPDCCPTSAPTLCGVTCVDLATDPANCGACGNICPSGTCTNGSCASVPTCDDGVKNGAETDVDCGGGACPTCDIGQGCTVNADCQSGACTNGTCTFCTPGTLSGTCAVGVGACQRTGQYLCNSDGSAYDVCNVVPGQPSPETCNGIDDDCDGQVDNGATCPPIPNATGICRNGACAYVCTGSFADCNGDLYATTSDGCETDTADDPNNCGGCGHSCPTSSDNVCLQNPTCSAGQCHYASGAVCALPTCSGNQATISQCDGSGNCVPITVSCDTYLCVVGIGCLTGCTNDADCITGAHCISGTCMYA